MDVEREEGVGGDLEIAFYAFSVNEIAVSVDADSDEGQNRFSARAVEDGEFGSRATGDQDGSARAVDVLSDVGGIELLGIGLTCIDGLAGADLDSRSGGDVGGNQSDRREGKRE